jgi:iron complex outermembrane receptor protein
VADQTGGRSHEQSSAPAESGGVEEVVVTAQRREESLQRVPLSVTAVTADAAMRRGVVDTQSLQNSVVGLDISRQVNTAIPFIRGIGNTAGTAGNEPSVASYVDDVYVGDGQAELFSFNNIERVEVLRGPQGTLFGRNATGGVIQVVTLDPTEETVLTGDATYANYNTLKGSLYGSVKLADGLSANIAAITSRQPEGWGRNPTTGAEEYSGYDDGVRSKVKFVRGNTTVLLEGDYTKTKFDISSVIAPGTLGPDGVSKFRGSYSPQGGTASPSVSDSYGGSLKIESVLGWASIRSISAYRGFRINYGLDQDAVAANLSYIQTRNRDDSYSEELQLLSAPDSAVSWIAGVFYWNDNSAFDPAVFSGGVPNRTRIVIIGQQITHSIAGFAQGSYEIAPRTTFTLGGRYTSDDRYISGGYYTANGLLLPGTGGRASKTFDKVTYRAAIAYAFTPDVTGYFSANRGFKSGVFNTSAPSSPAVQPEVLDALEVGLKNELLQHRLRVNLSAFSYDYKNIQVTQVVQNGTIQINAGSARIYGGELEIVAQPTRNLSVTAGLSYLHSRYTSFPGGPTSLFAPATCDANPAVPGNQPAQLPGPRVGGLIQCAEDLSGHIPPRSPTVTSTLDIDELIPTSVGNFSLNANLYMNSGFFWEPDDQARQDAYQLFNISLQWTEPHGRYYARLWGRNIFNQYRSIYAARSSLLQSQQPAEPRGYGLTVGFKF